MHVGNLATVFAAVITTVTMATVGPARGAPGLSGARLKIGAHTTNAYRIPLEAGEEATLDVRGSGSAELTCDIYDVASGKVVANGKNVGDDCTLTFTPVQAERLVLRVANRDTAASDFVVTTR